MTEAEGRDEMSEARNVLSHDHVVQGGGEEEEESANMRREYLEENATEKNDVVNNCTDVPAADKLNLKELPRTGKRGAPQAFPHLLYMMLERESQEIIHWCQEGRAFVIVDVSSFITKTLVKYFRHTRYASFQRQLNLYGFRKNDAGHFEHKYFLKDQPDLLTRVQRAPQAKPVREKKKKNGQPLPFGGVFLVEDQQQNNESPPQNRQFNSEHLLNKHMLQNNNNNNTIAHEFLPTQGGDDPFFTSNQYQEHGRLTKNTKPSLAPETPEPFLSQKKNGLSSTTTTNRPPAAPAVPPASNTHTTQFQTQDRPLLASSFSDNETTANHAKALWQLFENGRVQAPFAQMNQFASHFPPGILSPPGFPPIPLAENGQPLFPPPPLPPTDKNGKKIPLPPFLRDNDQWQMSMMPPQLLPTGVRRVHPYHNTFAEMANEQLLEDQQQQAKSKAKKKTSRKRARADPSSGNSGPPTTKKTGMTPETVEMNFGIPREFSKQFANSQQKSGAVAAMAAAAAAAAAQDPPVAARRNKMPRTTSLPSMSSTIHIYDHMYPPKQAPVPVVSSADNSALHHGHETNTNLNTSRRVAPPIEMAETDLNQSLESTPSSASMGQTPNSMADQFHHLASPAGTLWSLPSFSIDGLEDNVATGGNRSMSGFSAVLSRMPSSSALAASTSAIKSSNAIHKQQKQQQTNSFMSGIQYRPTLQRQRSRCKDMPTKSSTTAKSLHRITSEDEATLLQRSISISSDDWVKGLDDTAEVVHTLASFGRTLSNVQHDAEILAARDEAVAEHPDFDGFFEQHTQGQFLQSPQMSGALYGTR